MKLYSIIVVCIGSIITSCNFIPQYHAPEIKTPLVKESKNDIIYTSWQNFFSTPFLKKAIEQVLMSNSNYKVLQLQLKILEKQYDISKMRLVAPNVTAAGGYNKTNDPLNLAIYTAGLFASYEIDLFGSIAALKSSALSSFLSEAENIKALRISLISETVITYITALYNKRMTTIYREIANIRKQQENITKKQVKEGVASFMDLMDASYNLQSVQIKLSTFERAYQENLITLSQLSAQDARRLFPAGADIENIRFAEGSLSNLPSKSLLKRPDIKKAEYALKSVNANIGAARAAFFPSISLTGRFGYGSNELGKLFSGKGIWGFNPQINIPIFTAGQVAANRDIAYLRKNIYIAQYENTITTAFYEIQNKLLIKNLIQQKRYSFKNLVETRKQNLKIAQSAYNKGFQSLKNQLEAEAAYLSALEGYLSATMEYLILLTDIYRVLGGGSATP